MPSYAFSGVSWTKTAVSWSFFGPAQYASEVADAFARWDALIPLDFAQSTSPAADIVLDFADIDGVAGILGQANWQSWIGTITSAAITFDLADPWAWSESAGTFVLPSGVSFTAVALHEIGHVIGLAHTDDPATLMYPYASANLTDLTYWDIYGAQQLYGEEFTKPDLTASSPFAAGFMFLDAGDSVDVSFAIINLGLAAGISIARIYLSTDEVITSSDILVGTDAIAALGENALSPFHHITVSTTGIAPGAYYVGVIADADNMIAEQNEDNNAIAGSQITIVAPPDFVITTTPTVTSSTVSQGAQVRFDYDVMNVGGGNYVASMGIYLSVDDTITSSDALLQTDDFVFAEAPPSGTHRSVVISTDSIAPGTYYLGVIADPTDNTIEENENNNNSVPISFTITTPVPLADLSDPTVLILDEFIGIGQSLTLIYFASNAFNASAAGPSTTGIYLSDDPVISTDDLLLGTDEFPAISEFGTEWRNVTVALPDGYAPGFYYVGVVLDIQHEVAERIEWNNSSYAGHLTLEPFTAGDDVVTLTPLAVQWHAFDGNDLITGSASTDTIHGDAGNDTIFGGDGIDAIHGDEGSDTLVGNTDPLAEQSDGLDGGPGDDVIVGERSDYIYGDSGTDILYAANSYDWSINLGFASIEWMIAAFGNDTIDASYQIVGVTIDASGGNDTVTGSAYDDFLWAGVGNDTVDGGAGDDMLFGDLGSDILRGGAGDDVVFADNTDSVIDGGSGYDILYMTSGTGMTIDLAATGFEVLVDAAGGNDIITAAGSPVAVLVVAGAGNDDVTGSNDGDFLWGDAGNDVLRGSGGDDTLVGGIGADTLTGGAGIDQLFGGSDGNSDVYVYDSAAAGSFDFIYDFEAGIDRIEFSGVPGISSSAQLTIVDGGPGGNAEIYLGAPLATNLLFVVVGAAGQVHDSDLQFT